MDTKKKEAASKVKPYDYYAEQQEQTKKLNELLEKYEINIHGKNG